MKTKEQVKDKLGLSRAKDSLQKKARTMRENQIFFGFIFEVCCFMNTGAFFIIGTFNKGFYLLSAFSFMLALYLAFDVGNKIQTNARVNFIVENNINGRLRK